MLKVVFVNKTDIHIGNIKNSRLMKLVWFVMDINKPLTKLKKKKKSNVQDSFLPMFFTKGIYNVQNISMIYVMEPNLFWYKYDHFYYGKAISFQVMIE